MHGAEAVDGELDHVPDRPAFGDVDGESQRLAADGIDLFRRLLDAVFVDISAYDVRFLARENERSGPTDAAGGPGDDDGFPREIIGRLGHGSSPGRAMLSPSCPGLTRASMTNFSA